MPRAFASQPPVPPGPTAPTHAPAAGAKPARRHDQPSAAERVVIGERRSRRWGKAAKGPLHGTQRSLAFSGTSGSATPCRPPQPRAARRGPPRPVTEAARPGAGPPTRPPSTRTRSRRTPTAMWVACAYRATLVTASATRWSATVSTGSRSCASGKVEHLHRNRRAVDELRRPVSAPVAVIMAGRMRSPEQAGAAAVSSCCASAGPERG